MTPNPPYQLTIDRSSIKSSASTGSWWSATVKASMTDKQFIGRTETHFRIHAESHSSDSDDIEHELIKVAHHHMQYMRTDRERAYPSPTWTPASPLSSEPNIYTFIQDLDAYLCKRFRYRRGPCRKGSSSPTISASRSALSLHLNYPPGRYEHRFSRALVIGSLSYAQPGKGHGTDLLQFLATQAEAHKISTLIIESALTDECIQWATARGFQRDPASEDNWFVAIENLQLPST